MVRKNTAVFETFWVNSVLMLTNSRLRKKKCNLVLLERNYVEVSTWKMAAILTATVTTSFASLLAALPLEQHEAWEKMYYLSKKCRKRKVRRRICFDCPLLREFQFSHMLLLLLNCRFKSWKIIVRSSSQLTWSENRCPFGATTFFSLFSVLPTQKSTRKSAVKLTGSCQPPSRHIYFGGRARGGQRSWKKKKSPILMGSNADRKRRENCPPYRNLKYFQLD